MSSGSSRAIKWPRTWKARTIWTSFICSSMLSTVMPVPVAGGCDFPILAGTGEPAGGASACWPVWK